MKRLAVAIFALVLSACGGGGTDAGSCPFPGNCAGSSAGGAPPPATGSGFMRSGTGATTLTLPADVSQLRIQGSTGNVAENFAVRASGSLIVNAVIGTSQTPAAHDGTYAVQPGGLIEVFMANGVSWTLSSVATSSPGTGTFNRDGDGAAVFELPVRSARYLIRASYAGVAENFAVRVDGRLVVNVVVGTSSSPQAFDGVYALSGGKTEVLAGTGVKWSFAEQR